MLMWMLAPFRLMPIEECYRILYFVEFIQYI